MKHNASFSRTCAHAVYIYIYIRVYGKEKQGKKLLRGKKNPRTRYMCVRVCVRTYVLCMRVCCYENYNFYNRLVSDSWFSEHTIHHEGLWENERGTWRTDRCLYAYLSTYNILYSIRIHFYTASAASTRFRSSTIHTARVFGRFWRRPFRYLFRADALFSRCRSYV